MTDTLKILVMESETPVAMMIVSLLSQAGCEVQVANTGKKGLALALESKFDLFVLAVDLPDTNGFEICRELKQRHMTRHTPVIFISAQRNEEDRQRGLEAGAVDYIVRPLKPITLASRILSWVRTEKLEPDEPSPILQHEC